MRIRIKNELLIINICSLLLLLIIWTLPDIPILPIVLGIPFLLFFPGYVLIAALFPKQDEPPMLNRIILAFLFSIAISPLIGLFSNYMPWGITPCAISTSIMVSIVLLSSIASYRRVRTPPEIRFGLYLTLPVINIGKPTTASTITYILIISAVASVAMLIYAVTFPQHGERFTEFYMLGLDGEADFFPYQILISDGEVESVRYVHQIQNPRKVWQKIHESILVEESSARVTIGINNREYENASYQIQVTHSGTVINTLGPISLEHGESWREEIDFEVIEPCARTTLVQPTYPWFFLPYQLDEIIGRIIEVESTQQLQRGDTVRIGQAMGVVNEVRDNRVILEQPLRTWLPAETDVIEVKRIEFNLLKSSEPSQILEVNEEIQSLHLWIEVQTIME